jgi:hypothetical protein
VRFIVEPQEDAVQLCNGPGKPIVPGPPICMTLAITMCALCSEDPRFCEMEF